MVLAGLTSKTPDGSRHLPLRTNTLFQTVCDEHWDAVYLPGGLPAAKAHRADPDVQQLIQQRLADNELLAIICASPQALLPQDLASGRRLTSFPALREDMQNGGAEWLDQAVVCDQRLLTSQGPGTAAALALALLALLTDRDTAAAVAEAALFSSAWVDAQVVL